jgi:hypothetical protein
MMNVCPTRNRTEEFPTNSIKEVAEKPIAQAAQKGPRCKAREEIRERNVADGPFSAAC